MAFPAEPEIATIDAATFCRSPVPGCPAPKISTPAKRDSSRQPSGSAMTA